MKIAVACMGDTVAPHFGHCENFKLFDSENGDVTGEVNMPNPGHKEHGYLPKFLAEKGAEVIIAGCMGMGAVQVFNEKHIDVITGADGDAKTAAQRYLEGKLKTTGAVCQHHHDHDHGEGEHHCHHE